MKTKIRLLPDLIRVCCIVVVTAQLCAQPFVDPFQVRYMYAFKNSHTPATPFTHLWAGTDVPLKIKKLNENSFVLISPYYEQWNLDSADTEHIYPKVQSIALPVGLILPFNHSKWSLTIIPVARWNGEKLFADHTFQFGGATFASYARKPNQKFRIGVYANAEFFGLFMVPLLGCDWRMDDKNYLFGVLPGRLTYEHQWSNKFFGGATFRAPTTSYRLLDGSFIRLDDNQLSLYADYYPAKHFCVTLEAGYGVLRKIRTGVNTKEYTSKVNWGDGPFIKISGSYRIRL